jgi:hypothetical protein
MSAPTVSTKAHTVTTIAAPPLIHIPAVMATNGVAIIAAPMIFLAVSKRNLVIEYLSLFGRHGFPLRASYSLASGRPQVGGLKDIPTGSVKSFDAVAAHKRLTNPVAQRRGSVVCLDPDIAAMSKIVFERARDILRWPDIVVNAEAERWAAHVEQLRSERAD